MNVIFTNFLLGGLPMFFTVSVRTVLGFGPKAKHC